jgi:hypothetical protein
VAVRAQYGGAARAHRWCVGTADDSRTRDERQGVGSQPAAGDTQTSSSGRGKPYHPPGARDQLPTFLLDKSARARDPPAKQRRKPVPQSRYPGFSLPAMRVRIPSRSQVTGLSFATSKSHRARISDAGRKVVLRKSSGKTSIPSVWVPSARPVRRTIVAESAVNPRFQSAARVRIARTDQTP